MVCTDSPIGKQVGSLASSIVNERGEFMQETQHTQQTATRTAQNQDKKTT